MNRILGVNSGVSAHVSKNRVNDPLSTKCTYVSLLFALRHFVFKSDTSMFFYTLLS